jgi:hypothetical protein
VKTYTKNKTHLAEQCGFKSRQGLYDFMKHPDWPKEAQKGWDIQECREFVLKNTQKESIAATLDSDMSDLKKWDIYERARKQKIANDAKDKILMPVSEHESVLREALRDVSKELDYIPDRSPELTGQSAAEISMRLRAMLTAALKNLRALAEPE